MTGSETYKEFDNASIITSTGNDSISVGKYRFRKRDVLLGGIAVLALVLVIILAIVLAVEVSNKRGQCPEQKTSEALSGNVELKFCDTIECLRTGLFEKTNLNQSVSPCTDFYTFSCGGYPAANPMTPSMNDVTPFNKIYSSNIDNLVELLYYPVSKTHDLSYERKLKNFLQTCTGRFDKTSLRAKPFLDKVLTPLGGWHVLGNWDVAKFNFHQQLKVVHIDFMVDAFFTYILNVNSLDWNQRVVEFTYGGIGLQYMIYTNENYRQFVDAYKVYMRAVAEKMVADAKNLNMVVGNDTDVAVRVEEFLSDAFEVELLVAKTIPYTTKQNEPHNEENRLTLAQLTELFDNQLDFVDYLKTLFNDIPERFKDTTTVAVLLKDYFHKLGPKISDLLQTDVGKRKIHNYLVWQLMDFFAGELSWDYTHVKQNLESFINNKVDEKTDLNRCFTKARQTMADAINAEYVKYFIKQENKVEATEIIGRIKDELVNELRNVQWMTAETKNLAIEKIQGSLYKIGHAEYLINDTYIDNLYAKINITDKDHFGNILNMNQWTRIRMNELMKKPDARTTWAYPVYQPAVEYFNPWHELIATSALFQNPLFDHGGPDYYNYGSIGSLIASHLIHSVDLIGNQYKLDGSNLGTWWSNQTFYNYKEIHQCAVDAQKGLIIGPFTLGDNQYTVNVSSYATVHAPLMLADTSGLKLAYRAYKKLISEREEEKLPAGIHKYTIDQMFFVAYAQANCQNTADMLKLTRVLSRVYPSKERVNLAVSQLPEFRQAFQCKEEEPMAPKQTCTLV
ncbi:endothelin-converting enzyme homolog [Physella acuta]|uniref:endothelin-converting enzyme homolog n=1 Tax=Physella acuta TaxID=109671 RepID=UPI0027DDA7E6|nr:endothelin-converting enzyme homolog [Physella acuta]